jgi:hypothetical protein
MTDQECEQITRERLQDWGSRAIAAHETPLWLVTMGHDGRAGQIGIETCTNGLSKEQLARLLLQVAGLLAPTVLQEAVAKVMRDRLLSGGEGKR